MPVPVKSSERVKFDLEGLAREAGQLWGEAVHLFRKGAKWWIDAGDGEAYDQWEATRKARKEDEVFHDQVLALLLEAAERKDYAKRYSLVSIAAEVGFEKAAAGDRVAQAQLADTLRGLGLEKRRAARGAYWALTPEGVALLDRVLRDASQEERAEALRNHCH
jgi:predicted P-loop ATPase